MLSVLMRLTDPAMIPPLPHGPLPEVEPPILGLGAVPVTTAALAVDGSGLILGMNAEAERLTGYSREQLLGSHAGRLFAEDEREVYRDLRFQIPDGPSRPMASWRPVQLLGPDGRRIPLEARLRALGESLRDGAVVSLRPIPEDGGRESLRRHERRLEIALAAADLILFERDLETGAMDIPLEGRQLLGLPEDGPVGVEDLLQRLHPADRPALERAVRQNREDGSLIGGEYRVVLPDGSVRWVAGHGLVHRPPGDRPTVIGTFQDVTQRREEAQRHAESEIRLRHFIDAVPQLAWIADPDGIPTFGNRRWLEVTGEELLPIPVAIDDGVRESASRVLHPDEADGVIERWLKATRGAGTYQDVYRIWDQDHGEYRWHMARAVPWRNEEGLISSWFGTATDIHDQKLAEESLREANRLKEDFVRFASHELRSPLALILGYMRRLRARGSDVDPELLVDALGEVEGAADQLNAMVLNLLSMALADQSSAELEPVSLRAVIRTVLPREQRRFPERIFELSVDDQLPPVEANAVWVEQILANLVSNAAKYTPPETPIRVEASAGDNAAELRVLDGGPGIDPHVMARIFEPFYRAPVVRQQGSGIGLGLSVCRRLTELQGGRIWVRARPEGGTEFGFSLRAATFDDAHELPRPARPPS